MSDGTMRTVVIRVEGAGGDYRAMVFADDGAPGWAERPVQEVPLPGGLDPGARDVLLDRGTAQDRLAEIGLSLYQTLSAGPLGAAWDNGPGTRTFFDVRPDELRALPWELMARADGSELFLDHRGCYLRGAYKPAPPGHVLVPVRVLVAVGDPHDPALRAADEVDAIWAALREHAGEWHVEVLWGPDKGVFLDAIQKLRPHLLHFIGHSGVNAYTLEPALQFRHRPDEGWALTTQIISRLAEAPRMVYLNACRTAPGVAPPGGPRVFQEAAWNVAGAFERKGAQAILTMQGDIPSATAVRFTSEVYSGLAERRPLDEIVRDARRALADHVDDAAGDWALPSLLVNGSPADVLPIGMVLGCPEAHRLVDDQFFDVKSLIDRTEEHRVLWGHLDDTTALPRPTLVHGASGVGKSSLALSCVLTWRLRGCRPVYVDLEAPGRTLNWLDAVRQIRDSVVACLPDRAAEPRRRFDHALAYLCEGREPELPPAGDWRADTGGPWSPRSVDEPMWNQKVFDGLLAMLGEVAGDEPLMLAIDHFARIEPGQLRDDIVPKLFAPLLAGRASNVVPILIERTDPMRELLPESVQRHAQHIEVTPFARTIEPFRHYGALICLPFDGTWRQAAALLAAATDRPPVVMPTEVRGLAQVIQGSRAK